MSSNGFYLATKLNGTTVYFHRLIMDAKKGEEVDHIDKNSLNNHKSNLRLCTRKQNNQNASIRIDNITGYKGVSFNSLRNKFTAQINVNGKRLFLRSI